MSSKKFADRIAARSPLPRRETVEPVNMYRQPPVDNPTSGQDHNETSGQTELTTSPQAAETTSGQTGKTTKPQVEKYTTHLRPETIKAIKRTALDRDCRDYQIVQEALDAFLRD